MRQWFCTLSMTAAVVATTYSGNRGVGYASHANNIRSDVMDRPGFSKYTPPVSNRSATAQPRYGGHYSNAGTDVSMQIRFFKVQDVDVAKGIMMLKVWFRTSWTDERLAWNSSDYGGVDTVQYFTTNQVGEEDCEVCALVHYPRDPRLRACRSTNACLPLACPAMPITLFYCSMQDGLHLCCRRTDLGTRHCIVQRSRWRDKYARAAIGDRQQRRKRLSLASRHAGSHVQV